MCGKNLTAELHQHDAFNIFEIEPKSTLALKVYSAAIAASRTEVLGSYCSVKAVNDSLSIAVT